jgi:hypothetical protein
MFADYLPSTDFSNEVHDQTVKERHLSPPVQSKTRFSPNNVTKIGLS